MLLDAHCHLDTSERAAVVVAEYAQHKVCLLHTSVTPADYLRAKRCLSAHANAAVALGLHPWSVADGRAGTSDLELFSQLAAEATAFGEVGLDFSPTHAPVASHELQLQAFEQVCRIAARASVKAGVKRLISIHSVRAATEVLDILEKTGSLASCTCVFHWFSGTSNELHRAVQAGALFSINTMMLSTRRGREYARQLPEARLLLETDSDKGWPALEHALNQLSTIRGKNMQPTLEKNSKRTWELVLPG